MPTASRILGRTAHIFLCLIIWLPTAWAAGAPRKPKVRAITAFVTIDRTNYSQKFQQALTMLRQAKSDFEKGGYEVETLRITTQSFPEYTRGMSKAEALQVFHALDALATKESFLLSIGALELNSKDSSQASLLAEALASTNASASLSVAGDDGVDWNAVREAAKVIKYLEENSPNGARNFGFAATAMVPPNVPFFPASYHEGMGQQFSVGLEAGAFVEDVFAAANGDLKAAATNLQREYTARALELEKIALQVEKESGWAYMGLDATPAPNGDSSIGAAMEKLLGTKFGSSGTLSVAAIITAAVRSIPAKRAGYSGLMLPPLEDPVLAQRWSEGSYSLDSLLAYSAVCGTGLDAVALPGDVSQAQLERIIGDVASLAVKWHKPLTARLIPAPGKKAGDKTDFNFGYPGFPNLVLKPVD